MALDMANSDASSAKVRVLVSFYLLAADDTSSFSARTFAIMSQREIQCSAKRWRTQRPVQHITGLAGIVKSKGLREKPEMVIIISCSFIVLRYKTLFLSCRSLYKRRAHSKYYSKGWICISRLLAFVIFWIENGILVVCWNPHSTPSTMFAYVAGSSGHLGESRFLAYFLCCMMLWTFLM